MQVQISNSFNRGIVQRFQDKSTIIPLDISASSLRDLFPCTPGNWEEMKHVVSVYEYPYWDLIDYALMLDRDQHILYVHSCEGVDGVVKAGMYWVLDPDAFWEAMIFAY